jgi:hypothetical protein
MTRAWHTYSCVLIACLFVMTGLAAPKSDPAAESMEKSAIEKSSEYGVGTTWWETGLKHPGTSSTWWTDEKGAKQCVGGHGSYDKLTQSMAKARGAEIVKIVKTGYTFKTKPSREKPGTTLYKAYAISKIKFRKLGKSGASRPPGGNTAGGGTTKKPKPKDKEKPTTDDDELNAIKKRIAMELATMAAPIPWEMWDAWFKSKAKKKNWLGNRTIAMDYLNASKDAAERTKDVGGILNKIRGRLTPDGRSMLFRALSKAKISHENQNTAYVRIPPALHAEFHQYRMDQQANGKPPTRPTMPIKPMEPANPKDPNKPGTQDDYLDDLMGGNKTPKKPEDPKGAPIDWGNERAEKPVPRETWQRDGKPSNTRPGNRSNETAQLQKKLQVFLFKLQQAQTPEQMNAILAQAEDILNEAIRLANGEDGNLPPISLNPNNGNPAEAMKQLMLLMNRLARKNQSQASPINNNGKYEKPRPPKPQPKPRPKMPPSKGLRGTDSKTQRDKLLDDMF